MKRKTENTPLPQETLEKLHKVHQEILDVFVQICEENHLRYYLHYGTLLGAVRHQGPIPWDDDMDVCMPREDYEKFKRLMFPKINEGQYHIVCYELDSGMPDFLVRFQKRDTLFEAVWRSATNAIYREIWIDIFPLDNAPDKTGIYYAFICKRFFFWRRLFRNKGLKDLTNIHKRRRILHFLLQPVSQDWLFNRVNQLMQNWNKEECSNYVSWVGPYSLFRKETMPKGWFEPSTNLLYGGKYYCVPGNWDKVLTKLYGDYMTPPPIEERVGHGAVEIKL